MIKINRQLEEIHNRLIKCFTNNKVDIDIRINISLIKLSTSNKSKLKITAYISNHKFKLSGGSFSNECDSIEGFITHINYEMEGMPNWKPIKELKSKIV